ncbi:MAG: S41 family peptidase [Chitinophagaceae bacterium]|nr:S41 family peptidase [Chitinophagaceae bacterium]
MKRLQIWWPLLFALTLIAGMWIGFRLRKNIPESQGFFAGSKRSSLQEVMNLVRTRYVDSVNTDSLTEDAIEAMLSKLDPHTMYIPAVYTVAANEDLQGSFEGIGIEYFIINDTVHAVNVLPEGPSDKAGLLAGDKLIKVGDSIVAGAKITDDRIKKLLRGEAGSPVVINVLRGNKKLDFSVKRGTIPKLSVDAAYMINKETGFIHLNKFSRTSYEEFMRAIEKLKREGMKKLIFDLRGNGGGILDEAVDIVDEFLDSSKLVVFTQGLNTARRDYRCKRPGQFETGELVILVDEFSASASEVVAGALQDWDRATIIGRRTFGKGLVQEPFDLTDGSQLRLTVSRYYTPVGRNIQKPFANNHEEYGDEVYDRFHNGQSVAGDTSKHSGRAFPTLIKKRLVYGGGGIMPDFFVSIDTTRFSTSLSSLFYNRTFSKFIYNYYLSNPQYFKQFKNASEFGRTYTPTEDGWTQLRSYALKDSINLSAITDKDKAEIEKRFKSYMAMQVWRMEGYYEVVNLDDASVKKGLEVLQSR